MKYKKHHDYDFIISKMQSGGKYHYNSKNVDSLAHIDYIHNKNKLQILYYNIVLFIKYIKRVIKGIWYN